MTVLFCLGCSVVAYAVLGAVVCIAANRDRPAGMPAAVYAACRTLRRHLAARALLRRAIGARPNHLPRSHA
ncbi:MAG TPA: hypothetical protein VFH77_16920 [Streptomyces sp.]|nr:hypothetical protein [Streptomyces sp.]